MPNYDNTMKWLSFFGGCLGWVLLILLLGYILTHPSEVQIIASWFQRLFANVNSRISKAAIENELQGRVIKASKNLCKELNELLPYSIKINWVKETNKKAFFDDNKVILCMDHNRTRNQNIIYAINDYIDNGLLPVLNKHIDDTVMHSSKLVLTRKVISMAYKDGLNYFLQNIFLLETERDPELKELVEQLLRLDDNGMFVQILLRELQDKANKYALGLVYNDFKDEVREFIQYLHNIATREFREEKELKFQKKYFRMAIILVANLTTYNTYGVKAYIRRFKEDLKLGIDNIYFCARGFRKTKITINICKIISSQLNIESKVFHYSGRYKDCKEFNGVCIVYNNLDTTGMNFHDKLRKEV